MSEKLLAGAVAALVVVPLCATCIVGPVLFAGLLSGFGAWFGGLDLVITAALVLVVGLAVYAFIHKRGTRRALVKPTSEARQ